MNTELICLLFLIALFIFVMVMHQKEKQKLLDRLMARNFPEYVTFDQERKKGRPPEAAPNIEI